MSTSTTRERLLDAAEHLFAIQGFEGTSLRQITSQADANLASVNYHFGSKETLIHAVFARKLGPLNRERLRLLDLAEANADPPHIDQILEAFLAPAIRLRQEESGEHFMCLAGRIFSEPKEMQTTVIKQFDEVIERFTQAISLALPHLSRSDLMWRFFFMIGTMVHTLVGADILEFKSEGACDPTDVEGTIHRLVTFISAGMQSPATEPIGEPK